MAKNTSTRAHYRYQSIIESRLPELRTAEQAVAAHLAAHAEQLPFESALSIAKRLGVSSMTVGRTLKALGYRGLAELLDEIRSEVPDARGAPWFSRGAMTAAIPKNVELARALRAEVEALHSIYAVAETDLWKGAVGVVASADRVFVTGFQTERGLAVAFADQLAYIRPEVRYISVYDRSFADLRTEGGGRSCLVMVDTRRYSRLFRPLAEKAVELGIPLVLVTDTYCRWAATLTPYALQVRTDSGRFWDNNAPISSLLNLLLEDVIERLGESVHSHLEAASEFGGSFVGFERAQRGRGAKRGKKRAGRSANGSRPNGPWTKG